MTRGNYLSTGIFAAVLALGTACADDFDTHASEESATSTAVPSTSSAQPSSRPSTGGVRIAVSSHCGVLSLTFKGRLWLADPPLGDHNPPPGWDENETTGVFLRTGRGLAVFQGDRGQRASFRRAPVGFTDPNEGCE